jgi:membrane-associated phospholipid phosphatase
MAALLVHDASLSQRVAAWGARRPYRAAAWLAARTGDSLFWLLACALLLWRRQPEGWALLWAVAALGTAVAKGIFKRRRPSEKWAIGTDKYAFPSGHAARAGAVAVTLAFAQPAYGGAWLLWAAIVALARVALARHYLTDVLGGLLFGAGIGIVLYMLG